MRRRATAALVGVLLAGAVAVPRVVSARVPAAVLSRPTAIPTPDEPTGVGDVTQLTRSMRRAVHLATEAARADGIELRITSGWRSAEHQERLFAAAVAKYGSAAVARQWVLPPDESAHVRGEAVDVGPREAAAWLERHGVRWGLCRRYANEPWHFERLAGAKGSRCPALEAHA